MKTKTISVRLNSFDTETLEYICEKYKVTEANAVRKGIELLKEWGKEKTKKEIDNMVKETYAEWRKTSEEMGGSIDCGEQAVREDFSNFAGLNKEISFEEMLELETQYNKQ